MMNLEPNQILLMRKPAFGDVRALRQWHDSGQRSMKDVSFETRMLEQCLFLSYRRASREEAMTSEYQGANFKLDGIAGLNVDDFLAAGEGATCKEDLKENHQLGPASFRGRFSSLVRRYRLELFTSRRRSFFSGAEVF